MRNDYEIERDSLIKEAITMAKIELASRKLHVFSSETRKSAGRENYNHYFFTEFFHRAMNQLAFDRGLVSYYAAR